MGEDYYKLQGWLLLFKLIYKCHYLTDINLLMLHFLMAN
jgi:hypothetical protein